MNNTQNNKTTVTAVEWIYGKIIYDQTVKSYTPKEWQEVFKQAKQMEKEQIIEAYRSGRVDQQSDRKDRAYNTMADEYYQQTYKTK